MFLDHPAAKILSGVIIGGIFGLLAFETVHVTSAGPAPADYAAAPAPADVVPAQAGPAPFVEAGWQAPVSSPGGPLLSIPAPRPRPRSIPMLLTQQTTFACAARPGASKVRVGWALSLSGERASARSSLPGPAAAAYSTSLAWGAEAMSLAVSCSPGSAAAKSAQSVAQAPPAPRPMVPLDYPVDAQPMGLQVSGLFKPVTDAMP